MKNNPALNSEAGHYFQEVSAAVSPDGLLFGKIKLILRISAGFYLF